MADVNTNQTVSEAALAEEHRQTQSYLLKIIRENDGWATKRFAAEAFALITGAAPAVEKKS